MSRAPQAAEGSEPSSELFQRLRMAAMKLDLDPVGDLINEAAGELLRLKSLNAEGVEAARRLTDWDKRTAVVGEPASISVAGAFVKDALIVARSLLSRTT